MQVMSIAATERDLQQSNQVVKTQQTVMADEIIAAAGRQDVCLLAERLKTQAGVPIERDAQTRLLAE